MSVRAARRGALAQGRFGPSSVAGLLAQFDPSTAASITSAAGAVSQLADLSGNAHHVTQATGSQKPATGSRTINSLNVLQYNGAVHSRLDSAAFSTSNPVTILVVCACDAPAGGNLQMMGAEYGPCMYLDTQWRTFGGAAEVLSGVAANSSPHIESQVFNGASSRQYVDGTQTSTGNPGTSALSQINLGGASAPWYGAIAEVLLYSAAVSAANMILLHRYLGAKWGITVP